MWVLTGLYVEAGQIEMCVRSLAGKRVTTPAEDKSYVQQAKEGIAAAAAVTAEKAQQAYQ